VVKLSVIVLTYNHERYIHQCLESVVTQDLPHDIWEIIVADDCSTDQTSAIVGEFASRHSNFTHLRAPVNLGPGEIMPHAFELSRGGFIAAVEGDDYWIGTSKLGRQLACFDLFPELQMVGHRSLQVDEADDMIQSSEEGSAQGIPGWYPRGVILEAHTGSLMFRRSLVAEPQAWWNDVRPGDLRLKTLAAEAGPTAVLSTVWSARRVHAAGYWTSMSGLERSQMVAESAANIIKSGQYSRRYFYSSQANARRSIVGHHLRSRSLLTSLALFVRFLVQSRTLRAVLILALPRWAIQRLQPYRFPPRPLPTELAMIDNP